MLRASRTSAVSRWQPVAPSRDTLGHQLQRDGLAQAQVVGPIDLAHAATTQQADNAVSRGEDAARCKSRIVQRVQAEAAR